MDERTVKEGKTYAIIAYITVFGTIIAFFMNQESKNPFTAFHVRQGLGIWLVYFVIGYMVSGFDNWLITYSFWIFFSVLFTYGILGAASGKEHKLPLVGDLFQRAFQSLK